MHAVGGKPGLGVDRLVDVAVAHPGGVELEVQVSAEGPPGLADTFLR